MLCSNGAHGGAAWLVSVYGMCLMLPDESMLWKLVVAAECCRLWLGQQQPTSPILASISYLCLAGWLDQSLKASHGQDVLLLA